ncbi:MAG: hypothetical protein ACOCUV_00290 [bacterium]
MKKILSFLNNTYLLFVEIIILIVAVLWYLEKYEKEPLIVIIGSISAIITTISVKVRNYSLSKSENVEDEHFSNTNSILSDEIKDRENDKNHIINIFTKIFTMEELDFFIDKGLYPYLVFETYLKFDDLFDYRSKIKYHIYDKTLDSYIEEFIKIFHQIEHHAQDFTNTNNPSLLRPNTVMDCALTKEVADACSEVPKLFQELHKVLKSLVNYINNNYKDISL